MTEHPWSDLIAVEDDYLPFPGVLVRDATDTASLGVVVASTVHKARVLWARRPSWWGEVRVKKFDIPPRSSSSLRGWRSVPGPDIVAVNLPAVEGELAGFTR